MSLEGKKAPAGIADLLATPENERFHEIIDGELVRKAAPSARHGGAQAGLAGRLGDCNRRSGGLRPGGWRFAMETETRFEDDQIYRPDIAGWRRERLPELPNDFPMTVRPDWVCEIVSPSSEDNDVVKKMRTYRRCGVPHYWIIDPIAETLIVYRWTEGGNTWPASTAKPKTTHGRSSSIRWPEQMVSDALDGYLFAVAETWPFFSDAAVSEKTVALARTPHGLLDVSTRRLANALESELRVRAGGMRCPSSFSGRGSWGHCASAH